MPAFFDPLTGQLILDNVHILKTGDTVAGDIDVNGHVSIGGSATVSAAEVLSVKETLSPSALGAIAYGENVDVTLTTPSASFALQAIQFNARANHSSGNQGTLNGVRGSAIVGGAGTTINAIAGNFIVSSTAGGTITNARALQAMINDANGNITNATGLYVLSGTKTTGSITSLYGLYIEDQTSGTNNYAIYTNAGRNRFGGAMEQQITTISSTTTLDATHCTVLVDASSAAITVNLPAASGRVGRIYNIKRIDNSVNTVTIDGNASETIDGATTQTLITQWSTMTIQSNGTGWYIL